MFEVLAKISVYSAVSLILDSESEPVPPKLYEQVLRNENFKALWDNADYRALGDYSRFKPLAPSVTGAGSMPMPK